MCRITIAHTIRHRISSADLFKKLGLNPLDTYYHRRLLRWAGHVSRMPMTRAPRQLLTGWVDHKRPIGCPQMTWGRTLKKALVQNNLPADFKAWSSLAADRRQWRMRHEAAHLNRTATAKQPKSQMDRPHHHGLEVKSPQKENRNKTRLDEVRGQEKASLV